MLEKIKESNQSSSNAVPSKLSFAEVASGVEQNQIEQKKRSKNLALLVTKPDNENSGASEKRVVSEIAESLIVNMKIDCQKICNQNTEYKQLLRKKVRDKKKKSEELKRK